MGEMIEVRRDGHVAEVELVGGGWGHAMGPDFWRELPEVFDALSADPSVRAIVLYGAGEHFSIGLDLKGMLPELAVALQPGAAEERLQVLALVERLQAAVNSIESCAKPVIAVAHGWCIGGAIDVMTACDIRVSSADATFSVREIQLAIVADIGTLQRLPRIVGQGHARQLAMTGEDFDAARALQIGLVNDVHPDRAAAVEAGRGLARQIASRSPVAMRGVKRVMNWSADRSISDGLDFVATWNAAFLQSADLSEAVSAFMEKRQPVFQDS